MYSSTVLPSGTFSVTNWLKGLGGGGPKLVALTLASSRSLIITLSGLYAVPSLVVVVVEAAAPCNAASWTWTF